MVNTPRIMKKLKRALPVAMAIVLGSTAAPLVVRADSSKVVTLGANLTDSQKNSMSISELHLIKQKSSKLPMQTKENIWKESLPTNKSVPVPTAVLM